ncbi:MAG: hypothetical protein MJ175_02090 [Clostridia bacterium]|nr:hypothetical protein [Clostridia bacterium]
MDRKPNRDDSAAASALLAKLKKDLDLNASDKQSVAEEAAAQAAVPAKRYTFRVQKKSEYLAKKSIAEKISAAADDADITDEDLEAILRSYFSSLKETKAAAAEPADEPAEEPAAETPVTEELADAITDDLLEEIAALAPDSDKTEAIPAAEEIIAEAAAKSPQADTVIVDPAVPLTAEEEPFFEEVPVEIPVEDSIEVPDEDIADLIGEIPDIDIETPAEESAAEIPVETVSVETVSAEISVPETVTEEIPQENDEDLADLLAGLPDDAIEEITAAEDIAVEETIPPETIPPETISPETISEETVSDDEALAGADLAELLGENAVSAEETVLTETPTTDTEEAEPALGDSLDDLLGEMTPGEGEGDDEALAAMLAAVAGDEPAGDGAVKADAASEEAAPAAENADTSAADVSNAETETPGTDTSADPGSLDQTDLDLMIAFGMDEQLEKAVGKEEAKRYKQAIGERKDGHYNEMHMGDRPDTVQNKHAEYVSAAQNKEIFTEYKKQYSSLLFRFLGAILFLILLFLFENNNAIGLHMPALFDREQYPLVYTLFDLQLVLLCGSMIRGGIGAGIRGIFRGKPIPESITGFLFLLSFVYTGIIMALCPMHGLQLYNFPIALTVLFALCYEYMNLRREIMSFKIVSSKKLKYAVDAIKPQDGDAERQMFAEYISDDPSMFRIKRTAFVEGFFQRTETYPRTQRILRTIIPAVFLLTLAFFAAEFMLTGSVYSALTVAYITMLLTLPSGAFIAFSYPMYRASSYAYEKDSAMIGEASLGEYADASVVSFDDKEVFPAHGVRVRNVKIYGNNRIDHVIYAAASVFHVIGGPLADVFETATGELGYAENVKLSRIDPDGIEARVDGGAVLVGKASFMERYGYGVSVSESEKTMEETGDASILYIAYDNAITAKLYIQYSVDPEFETVLKQLYRQGVCVGIKTSDPNIDDHLLSCKIKMSKYPVKIIKCAEPKETAIIVDRMSSGIVSKANAKTLLQTLAMCDRVLSASRTNNVISVVSILLGMAAMAFFVVSGISLTAAPFWIALYQLFWIVPVIVVSRYHI